MWQIIRPLLLSVVFLMAACTTNETPAPEATSAPPADSPAIAAEGLQVGLAYGGDVYHWDYLLENPQLILQSEGAEIAQVRQSPDGTLIAFQEIGGGSLSIITEAGEQIASVEAMPIIQQMMWGKDQILYLNTAEQTTLGLSPRDDLYQFDAASGSTTQIEPGGAISISPSGAIVLLTRPGEIDGENGMIYRPGEAETPLLEFEAVAAGTHSGYYPTVQWAADDTRFYVAVPDANAFYSEFDTEAAPVSVYEVDLAAGSSQIITRVEASVYGLPQVSPINQELVFLRRADTSDTVHIMVQSLADETAEIYATGTLASLIPPVWLPDGERFLYALDGAYWLGQAGGSPARWIDFRGDVLSAPLLVGEFVLFTRIIPASDTVELRYANWHDETGASGLITRVSGQFLTFDAIYSGQ